jgi:hypothetical protein
MTGTVIEILEQAHYIYYAIEELVKKLREPKANQLKQQYCIDVIDSIIGEVHEHLEKLYIYAKKFKCSIDSWMERDIQRCLNSLMQAKTEIARQNNMNILDSDSSKLLTMRSYLRRHKSKCPTYFVRNPNKKMNAKILDNVEFKICGISGMWDDKYILHLEDWLIGLLPKGLYLNEDVIVYSADDFDAYTLMLENARVAERLFYNLENLSGHKHYQTTQLRNRFFYNRTTISQPVNLHNESGRIIITAYSNALRCALHNVDQTKLVREKDIFKYLSWPRSGKGRSWNSEKILRGYLEFEKTSTVKPIEISYQLIPFPGHLGNIFTRGVGRYGAAPSSRTPNILSVINSLAGLDPNKEKILAELFLNYKKGDGNALSAQSLRANGFIVPRTAAARRTLVNRINKIAYLICFQEVYRRKNQGYHRGNNNSIIQTLELPFGVAVSSALKLIADGYLRMQDVFDSDSRYGVFTGQSIMNKNIDRTIQKFNDLFVLFSQTYAHEIYDVFEFELLEENIVTVLPRGFYTEVLNDTDEKTNPHLFTQTTRI